MGMPPPNRPWKSKLPAKDMQTFQVISPMKTHTRVASCEEVECDHYARGWVIKIDLGTDLGQRQARYIKYDSGRSYQVVDQRDGLITLRFKQGQPCFTEHRVKVGRPEIYRVKGGDHRGNPLRTPVRTHKKPEFWLEEFQENQERLKRATEKG